ncbi:MAG: CYTH domain-containing protein [Patescibacteria group bacterium]|nr:CYTH domain-containing protein [Patescibacteria group bacterium]
MQIETEAKFLNVDHDIMRKKLRDFGAELVYEQKLMRRRNFDFPDMRLDSERAWVRLRDEGDKIELMIKQVTGNQIGDIRETAVRVADFQLATDFLFRLGMFQKTEQESKRELWKLNGTEIMLDEWPWVKTFIEIEADDAESVRNTAEKLELNWEDAIFDTVEPVYYNEYDVTREQIHAVELFKFGEPTPVTFKKKK